MLDKGGSFHTLMLDKDLTLNERMINFANEEKRKQSDMLSCRNGLYQLAQEKLAYIKQLG